MSFKDYYNILGLSSNKVTIDEIKLAYREQAKKYHPDMHVGDNSSEEKLKEAKSKLLEVIQITCEEVKKPKMILEKISSIRNKMEKGTIII